MTTSESLSLELPFSLGGVPSKEYMRNFFYPDSNSLGLKNRHHVALPSFHSDTVSFDLRQPLLESFPKTLLTVAEPSFSLIFNNIYGIASSENFLNQNVRDLFSIEGYVTRLGVESPYSRVMLYDKVTGQLLRQQITRKDGFFKFSDLQKSLSPFIVSFDSKNEMNPEVISKIGAQ